MNDTEKIIKDIRNDFPLLMCNNIAYLDNAATSQKPRCVIDSEKEFYEKYNANPFRGLYELSEKATALYEEARQKTADFINASTAEEIIFTRNATESLNLAAFCLAEAFVNKGDEILVSIMEHHSNLLPWQRAAKLSGAKLVYLECDLNGKITEEALRSTLTSRTKILAISHVSNVLGICNDLNAFSRICHENGTIIVADGAQSVPHMPVDVKALDVDFLAFSGHKMLAPMGIGVLYGKKELLEKMPPFLMGGEMIESVTRDGAVYAPVPHKFEAGTVNAAGAYALGRAIDYINKIGFEFIEEQEKKLCTLAMEEMKKMPHVHILGDEKPENHHGIITFTIDGVHPHDAAAVFDSEGVAVRAGHHCAQPLLRHLGTGSTTRASLAFYNTEDEIKRFLRSLSKIREMMGYGD